MKRITFDGNFCDIAKCADVCEGIICEEEACSQRKTWERLKAIEDILGNEYDLDRLRELAQADREGRCVVLPCAIGDPVYIIRWHIGSAAMGDETYRFVDSFPARFGVEMLGDFGKTVFRSYAEARKALEKEENRNG